LTAGTFEETTDRMQSDTKTHITTTIKHVHTVAALISFLLQLAACSQCRLSAAHFIASFKFNCSSLLQVATCLMFCVLSFKFYRIFDMGLMQRVQYNTTIEPESTGVGAQSTLGGGDFRQKNMYKKFKNFIKCPNFT